MDRLVVLRGRAYKRTAFIGARTLAISSAIDPGLEFASETFTSPIGPKSKPVLRAGGLNATLGYWAELSRFLALALHHTLF